MAPPPAHGSHNKCGSFSGLRRRLIIIERMIRYRMAAGLSSASRAAGAIQHF
jgi:hypothetical protein